MVVGQAAETRQELGSVALHPSSTHGGRLVRGEGLAGCSCAVTGIGVVYADAVFSKPQMQI